MKSAMSVRPRTSNTLTSRAFISARASITTVLSGVFAGGSLALSEGLGLLGGLGLLVDLSLPAGFSTALLGSFNSLVEVFCLTGTTLSVVWNSNGYPISVYAQHPA